MKGQKATNLLLAPSYAPGLGIYIDWCIMLVCFALGNCNMVCINL